MQVKHVCSACRSEYLSNAPIPSDGDYTRFDVGNYRSECPYCGSIIYYKLHLQVEVTEFVNRLGNQLRR